MAATKIINVLAGCLVASALFLFHFEVKAASLPRTTQRMLDDLKLPESMVAGEDDELAVSAALLDAAKREGTVRILGHRRIPKDDGSLCRAVSIHQNGICGGQKYECSGFLCASME